MDLSTTSLHRGEPVERFKPTTGQVAGWAGLTLAALVLLDVVLTARTVDGLRVATGVLLAVAVIWVTQFRPRITAYDDALVLHGFLIDTLVPYAAVERVTLGQTLSVWAGGRRYVCVGIGRNRGADLRRKTRARGQGGVGAARRRFYDGPTLSDPAQRDFGYHDFVEQRLKELVRKAEQRRDGAPGQVRRAVALPPVAELVGAGLLFALTLLL